jgi:Cft2 family RNA processing exonuclease
VLIPTFALERTQAVLNALQTLEASGAIPRRGRVVLDAPMGARMTDLYRRFPRRSAPSSPRASRPARIRSGRTPGDRPRRRRRARCNGPAAS